jgi:hypothetical protein
MAPPRRVAPPRPRPPPFPLLFPLCRAAAEPLAAPLVPSSLLLSDPSSRAPELPHCSPHPDRHLRPPAAPSPSRIPTEHHRRPPLPGELLPELPIPEISYKSLTPSPLPSCRTSSPPPATTGAPSPPTNAAVRRHWHRLTIDPSFRCAPVLSSLSGTFPVTPSRSPATPCRRRVCHSAVPRAAGRVGQLPRWAGLPGRGPAGISADRAWQAAAPRGL